MARSIDTAKPKIMKLINVIKKQTNLKESAEVINQLLVEVFLTKGISTKELASKLNLPIPVVTALSKEWIKLGLMISQGGKHLSRKGRIYVEQQLGWSGVNLNYYIKLSQLKVERELLCQELIAELSSGIQNRPTVTVEYDQAFATIETSVARACLLLDNHQLINKQILFLGDDDLTSLAVGLLMKKISKSTTPPTPIIVYDMSQEIIQCLEESAVNLDLNIICHQIDFREGHPDLFSNQFDVVFTDPPYTMSGLKLFLSRAIAGSKADNGRIYLSFGKKEPELQLAVQQLISNQNLIMSDSKKNFNQYHGAAILGGKSDLYTLKTTPATYPIISAESPYDQLIYTGELKAKASVYQCDSCLEHYQMKEQLTILTIEKLKNSGCYKCGNNKFKRLTPKIVNFPKNNQSLGNHYLLELNNCPSSLLSSVSDVEEVMLKIVQDCHLTAVNHCFHQFQPYGVSGVVILAESHFTIHTWPELNYAAVDLFVCQELESETEFVKMLGRMFEASELEYQKFERGQYSNHSKK